MSPRPDHLSEISMQVTSLRVSQHFYQRVLGLDLVLEEPGLAGVKLPGGSVLLLFERQDPGQTPSPALDVSDRTQVFHVKLAIPESSLADWDRHLMMEGVAVESRDATKTGSTLLYFRDPDGHSVELYTVAETYSA